MISKIESRLDWAVMNFADYIKEVAELKSVLKKYNQDIKTKSRGICTTFKFGGLGVVLNYEIDPWEKQYGLWNRSIEDEDADWQDQIEWFDTRDELISSIETMMRT